MHGTANASAIVAIPAASPAHPRPWRRRQAPASTEASHATLREPVSLPFGRLLPIVGAALWLAACGAGAITPAAPSANPQSTSAPPPPTTAGFQITPQPDVVLAGSAVALTARNTSTGAVVEPTWSSSDSTVAVVSVGQLQALHAGVVTITADLNGTTNTFIVRVVPDYTGTYDGTMFIADCINGTVPIYCRGFARTGRFVARLTQAKDTVSGTLSVFGGAPGSIEGRIDSAGRLTVTGRLGNPGAFFIDIETWSTFLDDTATQMFGSFTLREMDGAVHRGSKRVDLPGIDRVR